jgi:hypothetical protein
MSSRIRLPICQYSSVNSEFTAAATRCRADAINSRTSASNVGEGPLARRTTVVERDASFPGAFFLAMRSPYV